MAVEGLQIKIGADIQEAQKGLAQVENLLGRLGTAAGGALRTIGQLTSGLISMGKQMAGLAIASAVFTFATDQVTKFIKKIREVSGEVKYARDRITSIADATKKYTEEAGKERSKITLLVEAIKTHNLTRNQQVNAVKQLQKIAPEQFANITKEGNLITNVTAAYDKYVDSIERSIRAKVLETVLQEDFTKLMLAEKKVAADRDKIVGQTINKESKLSKHLLLTGQTTDDVLKDVGRFSSFIPETINKSFKNTTNEVAKIKGTIKATIDEIAKLGFGSLGLDKINKEKTIKIKPEVEKNFLKKAILKDFVTSDGFDLLGKFDLKDINKKITQSPLALTIDKLRLKEDIIDGFRNAFEAVNSSIPDILLQEKLDINLDDLKDGLQEYLNIATRLYNVNQLITESLRAMAVDGFSALGDAIGSALSGGGIGDLFANFKTILADGFSSIGKQLIAAAPIIAALKAALKTLNPALLLPAGVALTAIGAALRRSIGATPFAHGGLVYGPTLGLVGEGRGTNRANPEVIAPLDKLKNIIGDVGGSNQVLTHEIAGDKLRLILARTDKRQGRSF